MAEIPLTQGKVAVVNDADLALVSGYAWYAKNRGARWYAQASVYTRVNGIRRGYTLYMHRLILPTEGPIDHQDGDGLNNRRENLRPCTNSQNKMNQGKYCLAASRYKGVSLDRGRWKASIRCNGVLRHLGSFRNEEDAARAYNAAALKTFGEWARPNPLARA